MGVEEEEEALCSKNMKETVDELEETLSLCDLPLYSDQEFSLTSNSNSTSSHEADYFEFFSQELAGFPPKNIVFCGKLIPHKKLSPCKPDQSNQPEIKIEPNPTRRGHCGSKLKFSSAINAQPKKQRKKMYNTNKHGFPTRSRRMSIVAAPPRKAKWYFFLFGISRFPPPPVVELTEIRRPPPSLSSPPPMFGKGISTDRRWGFWGLIRALSCGGNH